jgi:hypothetical protein
MKKYCRNCGNRLTPPDDNGNLHDGAFWRFNNWCLKCRLSDLFKKVSGQ